MWFYNDNGEKSGWICYSAFINAKNIPQCDGHCILYLKKENIVVI